MKIANNTVVGMHYTLKNDDGAVIDSSEGREPLLFLHGAGNIIRGLEKSLAGKSVGDAMEVTVEPEEGYGTHHQELVQQVPRTAFDGIEDLQVGMHLQINTDRGPFPVRVALIEEEMVTIDGNHELAGQRLHFSVSIESVREATEEELAHGHAH